MHRCSSGNSQGNMVGPCTCGLFPSQTNSFSMLFSMPNHKPYDNEMDHHMYPYTSSSSSSVDCTLSLGTPSTRLSDNQMRHHERRPTSSCMSNFCWDILQTSKNPPSPSPPPTHKNSRSGNTSSGGGGGDRDPLLARRCANCDTTSTPLWRNGPRGPKSLCNACGIRFKKEERRASAASITNGGGMMEAQQMSSHQNNNNNSWIHHSQAQRMPCLSPAMGNEFRFIEDDDRDSDAGGIPFLSWRLNVTDRPGLVHDFTR